MAGAQLRLVYRGKKRNLLAHVIGKFKFKTVLRHSWVLSLNSHRRDTAVLTQVCARLGRDHLRQVATTATSRSV